MTSHEPLIFRGFDGRNPSKVHFEGETEKIDSICYTIWNLAERGARRLTPAEEDFGANGEEISFSSNRSKM